MTRTLAGRIAVLTILVVALGFTLTGAIIVNATGRAQTRALEADLADRLLQFDAVTRPDRPGDGRPARPGTPISERFDDIRREAERALGPGAFLVIRTDEDGVLLSIGDAPETLPPATDSPSARPGRGRAGGISRDDLGPSSRHVDPATGRTYLIRSVDAVGPGRATIQIGADIDRTITAEQSRLRNRFLLIGGVATALVGLATLGVTTLATRPLRRLREATETVAQTHDLTTRVHLDDATREVEAVADGLNTMLSRLERSSAAREAALHAARRFAADAGHELRTPLTSVQTTLDSLERNPDLAAGARQEALAEVAEETRRLARLLESLQTLARVDAAGEALHERVDLDAVIGDAVSHAAAAHRELTVTTDLQPVSVIGTQPWLRIIADNLLRNTAIHGPIEPGGTVAVRIALELVEGWALLTIDDDGPGIPVGQRDAVLERFNRGADASVRPGSGLGLSLVAQLAALHGGGLSLADSPAGGLRVQVRLPAATL